MTVDTPAKSSEYSAPHVSRAHARGGGAAERVHAALGFQGQTDSELIR